MKWFWTFVIVCLNKNINVTSSDIFLMTSDKCVTNSTLSLVVTSSSLNTEATDQGLGQDKNKFSETFKDSGCGLLCSKQWTNVISLHELITDGRWEDLKTTNLIIDLNLTKIYNSNGIILLPMSVRSEQIEIMFCGKEFQNDCIIFTLQRKMIGIKICNRNDVELKRVCTHFVKKEFGKTNWISDVYWSHILIKKNNFEWTVILNNKEILFYEYGRNLKNIENVTISNFNGLVKIHEYKYLYTSNPGKSIFVPRIYTTQISCFKFWVKMCETCSLVVTSVEDQNGAVIETIQTTIWKEIEINLPNLKHVTKLYLDKISSEHKDIFWAIGDFSQCTKPGLKSISRKTNEHCNLVDEYGNLIINSEIYNEGIVTLAELTSEEKESYYKNCTDEICGKSKVCEFSYVTNVTCYCPPGTEIDYIKNCKQCNTGFYGWNCAETCEGCNYGCNYRGLCINRNKSIDTCKSNEYIGEYCNRIPRISGPLISKTDKITKPEAIKHDNVKIYFNTDNNINAVFNWSYPNLTERKIKKFLLEVDNKEHIYDVPNKAQMFFSMAIEVPPEKLIQLKFQACNFICSTKTQIEVGSPPLKAEIKEDTFKFTFFNDIIIIRLPIVEKKCKQCNTDILLAISNYTEDMNFEKHTIFRIKFENYVTNYTFNIERTNTIYSPYFNKTIYNPRSNNEDFKLAIQVINTFKGQDNKIIKFFKISENNLPKKTGNQEYFGLIAIISFVILSILLLIGIIVYCKRKNVFAETDSQYVFHLKAKNNEQELEINLLKKSSKINAHSHSKMIPLMNFKEYMKTSLENNELDKQFKLLPKDPETSLLTFDTSRVILEKIYEDDYSDSINANYIEYKEIQKGYIASEGPKNNFINDFWKMIWQENVSNIVMIGNILDETEEGIVQYWPETNANMKFLDITVSRVNRKLFANYIDREFLVIHNGEERKINHLQYISWPNQGFPLCSHYLTPFLQRMSKIKIKDNFPILVHCSTGGMRTGTIILCDITLRIAKFEKKIDIFNTVSCMKSRRPSLVGDVNQYKVVHLVVLESLFGLNTGIICNAHIKSMVPQVITNDIDEQMKYLKELECFDGIMKSNVKSTFVGKFMVINEVYVSRYQEEKKIVVGKQPVRDTMSEFWKMVTETHCPVIICLNKIDKTMGKFWPSPGEVFKPTEDVHIKCETTEKFEIYKVVHLIVYSSKMNYKLDLVLFNNWMPNQIIPNDARKFVAFIEKMDLCIEKSKITIITCSDGTTACGLFLALIFVIKKINLERVCDVCQAVRHARLYQKQFVKEKEQFIFLYEAALEYMKILETYANFNE